MIQRIQSLYLFLTTFFSGLFLSGSIFSYTTSQGNNMVMNFSGIYQTAGENAAIPIQKMILFAGISLLIPAVSLIAVFLFKYKRLQIKLTILLFILEILLIAIGMYYYIVNINNIAENLIPGFRCIIPLLTIILTLLAISGIKKDEKLIRSYDRLR